MEKNYLGRKCIRCNKKEEAINYICIDCMEEERFLMISKKRIGTFIKTPWEQWKLECGGIKNGC